eukprot:scaffold5766_cov36-Phaeocystis_antarctica.AAC.1
MAALSMGRPRAFKVTAAVVSTRLKDDGGGLDDHQPAGHLAALGVVLEHMVDPFVLALRQRVPARVRGQGQGQWSGSGPGSGASAGAGSGAVSGPEPGLGSVVRARVTARIRLILDLGDEHVADRNERALGVVDVVVARVVGRLGEQRFAHRPCCRGALGERARLLGREAQRERQGQHDQSERQLKRRGIICVARESAARVGEADAPAHAQRSGGDGDGLG